MFRPRILFADNNRDFLDTRAEFLQSCYEVVKAYSVEEARDHLQERWVHLAILDLRLTEDNDEHDNSGLILARESPIAIPKIILTGKPTVSLVREAFRDVAVDDFLSKHEGATAMLQTVEKVFATRVRINWNLDIHFKSREPSSFVHLVSLIEPHLEGERLLGRAEELTDLFRRLFFELRQLHIGRLLWQRDGRVALVVFAFTEDLSPDAFVVVCGPNAAVKADARLYHEAAPKAAGNLSTTLSFINETTHFAATAYALAGANLETVRSLKESFRIDSEKAFHPTLATLLQKTLPAWHREHHVREDAKTLAEVYRARVAWPAADSARQAFEQRIDALLDRMPLQSSFRGIRFTRTSGVFTVRFHEHAYEYPDPLAGFPWEIAVEQPTLLVNTPGEVSGESVLTDGEGGVWPTDFSRAGLVPILWNFIALEALLRFDWLEEAPLQWRHALELCLVGGDFSRFDQSDLEAQTKKTVRTVQIIRKEAALVVGNDPRPYHLGMVFQAAGRLLTYDPALPLTANELTRFVHLLIAMAMLHRKISQRRTEQKVGIQFDKKNKLVFIDGAPVNLSMKNDCQILSVLNEHTGPPYGRKELFERVFEVPYDKDNESHDRRLDTAIHRLRVKIELDPSNPRYLLTDPRGYRLVPKPKD